MDEKDEIVLYDSADIQRIFKCGRKQLYALLHTEGFPTLTIGRRLYVEKCALERWLVRQQGKTIRLEDGGKP